MRERRFAAWALVHAPVFDTMNAYAAVAPRPAWYSDAMALVQLDYCSFDHRFFLFEEGPSYYGNDLEEASAFDEEEASAFDEDSLTDFTCLAPWRVRAWRSAAGKRRTRPRRRARPYDIDGEESKTVLRLSEYGGDEVGSWVLLEAATG